MVLYKVLCIAFCFLEIQTQVLVPTPTALRASAHPCQETLQTVPLPEEAIDLTPDKILLSSRGL